MRSRVHAAKLAVDLQKRRPACRRPAAGVDLQFRRMREDLRHDAVQKLVVQLDATPLERFLEHIVDERWLCASLPASSRAKAAIGVRRSWSCSSAKKAALTPESAVGAEPEAGKASILDIADRARRTATSGGVAM